MSPDKTRKTICNSRQEHFPDKIVINQHEINNQSFQALATRKDKEYQNNSGKIAKVAEDLHNIFVPDAAMLGTAIKVVRYVNCTDPFESP